MKKTFAIFSMFVLLFGLGFLVAPKAEAGFCMSIPGVTPYGQCANNPGYDYAGPSGNLLGPGWFNTLYGSGYGYGYGYAPSYSNWYGYSGYGGWNGYGFPNRGSYYNGLPTYPAYYGNYYGSGFGIGGCYYTSYGTYVCG